MIQLIGCSASNSGDLSATDRKTQPCSNKRSFACTVNLLIVGTTLILGGCATPGSFDTDSDESAQGSNNAFGMGGAVSPVDRTIINDLVDVASQIFNPLNTTLQINNAVDDSLQDFFINSFSDKGFGIQRVSADQGANYFSYIKTDSVKDGLPAISYSATIGAVDISREYSVPATNVVSPASPVKLSGTRVAVKVLDVASGRKQVNDATLSTAQYFASLNLDEQAPVISLITPDIVDRVTTEATQGPSFQGLNSSSIEVNNLFYGSESTFSSILDSYDKIDTQIIIFDNDSMILGNTNKALIDQFVEQRLGDNDLIGLVGCSNGPTALAIGNEGLALGRAKRVTQALMSRGIPRDRVLDEGCWAPVSASDRFPSRGVVLELWRRST